MPPAMPDGRRASPPPPHRAVTPTPHLGRHLMARAAAPPASLTATTAPLPRTATLPRGTTAPLPAPDPAGSAPPRAHLGGQRLISVELTAEGQGPGGLEPCGGSWTTATAVVLHQSPRWRAITAALLLGPPLLPPRRRRPLQLRLLHLHTCAPNQPWPMSGTGGSPSTPPTPPLQPTPPASRLPHQAHLLWRRLGNRQIPARSGRADLLRIAVRLRR